MKKSFLKKSLETAKIAVELTLWGLKWPPDVQFEDETCSTIFGTHVQAILDHEKLTGLAGGGGGVREGQNMAQNAPPAINRMQSCWLPSSQEAPRWAKDPSKWAQMVPPNAHD